MDAWLLFFTSDNPEDVIRLIEEYPEFQAMYEQAYQICRNMGDVMGLFSEELRILDRNTVQYMIEHRQNVIKIQGEMLDTLNKLISTRNAIHDTENELLSIKNEIYNTPPEKQSIVRLSELEILVTDKYSLLETLYQKNEGLQLSFNELEQSLNELESDGCACIKKYDSYIMEVSIPIIYVLTIKRNGDFQQREKYSFK